MSSELSSIFKWWQAKDVALIFVPSILMFLGKSDMCHVHCTVGDQAPNKKMKNINYGYPQSRDENHCGNDSGVNEAQHITTLIH